MYIVYEIQTSTAGVVSTLDYTYENQADAESKYHLVLSYAAKSDTLKHACVLMTEEGFYLESKCYIHSQPEPEPEPEPEETVTEQPE